MSANTSFDIQIKDRDVRVQLIEENRRHHRISFSKNGLIIRLVKHAPLHEKKIQVERFLEWARSQVEKKPDLLGTETPRLYFHGQELSILDTLFTIQIVNTYTQSSAASLNATTIRLELSQRFKESDRQKQAGILISRCLGKFFQPVLWDRLNYWNQLHFQRNLLQLRLKNNASNWGSCSYTGNINISTRLLLAPMPVIDYVLVHELTHLIHFNHSTAFWNKLASVLPDYEQHENWLRKEGKACYF